MDNGMEHIDTESKAGTTPAELRPRIKLQLVRNDICFGPGIYRLLRLIDETGSVRLACQSMGMSYSKGWRILARTEQQLGYPVVERQQGGKSGGASSITEQGVRMMRKYEAFTGECERQVQALFEKYFGDE